METAIALIFLSRMTRLFAYGGLAVVLVMYLESLGWGQGFIGVLLTATLIGDTILTLAITSVADRRGRRNMLLLGGLLMALEQSILAHAVRPAQRSRVLAWYNLAGFCATALGSLCGGAGVQALLRQGLSERTGFQFVLGAYALLGLVLAFVARKQPSSVEESYRLPGAAAESKWKFRLGIGLDVSKKKPYQFSGLLALDAFGSGFLVQSLLAYWLHIRFGMDPAQLGIPFFIANLISAVSALLSSRLSGHVGLLNVMVFAHLPSMSSSCSFP